MAVALVAFLHPWSESKSDRIKSLIKATLPEDGPSTGLATTRIYATPSTRPKAPSQQLTSTKPAGTPPLLIAEVNVYSSRRALDEYLAQGSLKAFQKSVADESLYAQPGEMKLWSVVGGFVNREARERDIAGGKTVMLARFECKDSGAGKGKVIEALS
jgi:hypothetical protein